MEKILIGGGSGLVGTALAGILSARGHEVVILSRNGNGAGKNGITTANWDTGSKTIDPAALANATVIVNLAGAGVVDKRWSDAYKHEILQSRVNSSETIIRSLQQHPNHVHTIINASAIGFYGPDKTAGHSFIETDAPDNSFLGSTCKQWEESIQPVTGLGKRLVIFRLGIVLSRKGGALAEFLKPLRFHMAAVLGNGKQSVSWIHIEDLCNMILFAIEKPGISGVFNAIAPNPVSNELMTVTLAKIMHGNAYVKMHVPASVLKVMMGESSIEVLKSAYVSAEKILQAGFKFSYPSIDTALINLVKHN